MFKTIEECNLELVAYSESNYPVESSKHGTSHNLDFMPCSAARVSFGNEDKTGNDVEKDRKLMRYLASHKHMTPFEYQHATFLIECPLFIRSQIHRHRTFSFNEISRRYTDENLEFWIPTTVRGQSESNRQASSDQVITGIYPGLEDPDKRAEYEDATGGRVQPSNPMNMFRFAAKYALMQYNYLLEGGVAREQARAVLPQNLLTKFYMGGDLRAWAHFVELRRDEHAQKEVQVVAERVAAKLRGLWPESCNALGI